MGEASYCETCEAERQVVKTVGWQPDVCKDCGNPVED